jgi:hypothetical protein
VWLHAPGDRHWQALVNPYTGAVMGDREWESSWVGIIYDLHYKLLAGDTGTLIMGIVALLTLLLSITGIVLWPGWRKLMAGFKIKWNWGIPSQILYVFVGIAPTLLMVTGVVVSPSSQKGQARPGKSSGWGQAVDMTITLTAQEDAELWDEAAQQMSQIDPEVGSELNPMPQLLGNGYDFDLSTGQKAKSLGEGISIEFEVKEGIAKEV